MEYNNPSQENKKGKIRFTTVLLLVLLIVPLIFLLLNRKKESLPTENNQSQKTSISLLEDAKQVVANTPNYSTYLNLSLQYYNLSMFEECIAACNKALTYDANGDAAYNNIGAAYGKLGKYEKEIEACEKALLINPNNQLAKNNLIWAKEQIELNKVDSLAVKNK